LLDEKDGLSDKSSARSHHSHGSHKVDSEALESLRRENSNLVCEIAELKLSLGAKDDSEELKRLREKL